MTIILTLIIVVLWSALVSQFYINRKNFEPVAESGNLVEDTVHHRFVLNLAMEANEMRLKEEMATDETEKAHYRASMSDVSIEVVDTILAMNGFDPHPDELLDDEDDEEDKVIDFGLYFQRGKD